ncbi:MAG: hypothetical protein EXR75_10880 [Myxococcales bacterium]|nr:hypothetical protein [Myxococcales bacterium]
MRPALHIAGIACSHRREPSAPVGGGGACSSRDGAVSRQWCRDSGAATVVPRQWCPVSGKVRGHRRTAELTPSGSGPMRGPTFKRSILMKSVFGDYKFSAVACLGGLLAAAAWAGCTGNPNPIVDHSGTSVGGAGGGGVCPGGTLCKGSCTNTAFDPKNCGACGAACGDGEVCSDGTCGVSCLGGTTKCGELCVNIGSDPANCGACAMACAVGELCSNGICGLTCEDGGGIDCGGVCVNSAIDANNCGACGMACDPGLVCAGGTCQLACSGGTKTCGSGCVDVTNDPNNCGDCGTVCDAMKGEVCSLGVCSFECIGGTTECSGLCVDTNLDVANCGGCAMACKAAEVCTAGKCLSVCGAGLTKCGNACVDMMTDDSHCGGCATVCKSNEDCKLGKCEACNTVTTDCDADGWKVADGDCCDLPGSCGADPKLVNPGAVEVKGNGVDDNCNGKLDLFDPEDTVPCDQALTSNSQVPGDYAKALGICRTTTLSPLLKDRTWGLIEAKLLRANGTALPANATSISLRNSFGAVSPATVQGQRAAVLSTGLAADYTQTLPGPNTSGSTNFGSNVNISTCVGADCIKDWFTTANPPLKKANELPVAPNCGSGSAGEPAQARDSVMLKLKLRAPTNARAFSFNSYFMSNEYPEFVCSDFNDQFAVLIDTAKPPTPIPNPIDKNLMVFSEGMAQWPIGINVASGTSLFNVCETQLQNTACWDTSVSAKSCSLGAAQLAGSGFGKDGGGICTKGGGTYWLTTSGNVAPGETVDLRIVIWDVGDDSLDSLTILDGFEWLANATLPGTDAN